MTQQELADSLGIAKSSVSMYENGKHEPSFHMVERLAKLLDCTPGYLLYGTFEGESFRGGFFESTDFHNNDMHNAQESDLVQTFRTLNPLGKDEAIFYVHHLADRDIFTKEDPASE